jgi:type IV secretion system protein VirB1
MLPGLELMGCQNLAVAAEVMRHVVNVESSANPFAIGIVGARLVRQPENLAEAVATANMLEANGYNYSLGLAQVNRVHFGRYGFDTPAKAFDVCANLSAGANILADCFKSAGGRAEDWGKAFSCYYSGNFTTGFTQGYVQKIYDSMLRSTQVASGPPAAAPIPVAPASSAASAVAMPAANPQAQAMQGRTTMLAPSITRESSTAAQLIGLRSMPIDNASTAASVDASAVLTGAPTAAMTARTVKGNDVAAPAANGVVTGSANRQPTAMNTAPPAGLPFVPQVHGPNDPPPEAATADNPVEQRQGMRDSAFVF